MSVLKSRKNKDNCTNYQLDLSSRLLLPKSLPAKLCVNLHLFKFSLCIKYLQIFGKNGHDYSLPDTHILYNGSLEVTPIRMCPSPQFKSQLDYNLVWPTEFNGSVCISVLNRFQQALDAASLHSLEEGLSELHLTIF